MESFLGLANFYNRYIPKFFDLIQPVVNLRKMNSEFKWGEKQDIVLNKPTVKAFDPKKEIVFITDVSESVVSEILLQECHSFVYLSRKLTLANADYSNKKSLTNCLQHGEGKTIFIGPKILIEFRP